MIETFIAVLLGIMRLAGEKHIFFQAIAHIFVTGLYVSWWYTSRKLYLALAVGLTVLEIFSFIFL